MKLPRDNRPRLIPPFRIVRRAMVARSGSDVLERTADTRARAQAPARAPQPYSGFDRMPIAGEWRQGGSNRTLDDRNPYSGETLLSIRQASRDDLEAAYAGAAKAGGVPEPVRREDLDAGARSEPLREHVAVSDRPDYQPAMSQPSRHPAAEVIVPASADNVGRE
jgi:hypothetical protein